MRKVIYLYGAEDLRKKEEQQLPNQTNYHPHNKSNKCYFA